MLPFRPAAGARPRPARFRCAHLALLHLLAFGPAIETAPAHATLLDYVINPQHGSIGFSVNQLGIFSVDGHFTRFAGRLAIDAADPARSRIDVTIDAGSAAMASARAVSMLRSPAYFDVAKYPAIHFRSRSIVPVTSERFIVNGVLTIRGIAHKQSLEATLVREKHSANGATFADFKVTGTLDRSSYGMTANENFVGDKVDLSIFMRLTLAAVPHPS